MEAAAGIAFRTIAEALPELSSVQHIRFVLYGESDLEAHARALRALEVKTRST